MKINLSNPRLAGYNIPSTLIASSMFETRNCLVNMYLRGISSVEEYPGYLGETYL